MTDENDQRKYIMRRSYQMKRNKKIKVIGMILKNLENKISFLYKKSAGITS